MAADTRQRIVAEAMRLFAEQGYARTTVEAIERAAGLSPGSGSLYKHFKSKEEVLAAALERHVARVREAQDLTALMPLGDLRAELTLIARWILRRMEEQRDLLRLLFKEGDSFPQLLAQVRDLLVEGAYGVTVAWLRTKEAEGTVPPADHEANAAVAFGALVNYGVHRIVYGAPPLGLDQERFVAAWVDACATFAGAGLKVPER